MLYSVSADQECVVDIHTGIDGEVWDINGPHLEEMQVSADGGILTVSAVTHQNRVPVAVSESVVLPDWTEAGTELVEAAGPGQAKSSAIREIRQINLKNPFTLFKFAAHVSGNDTPDPVEASRALCQQAAESGFDALLSEHSRLWAQRWDDCDIQIDGDPEAQQALRFSIYHLLAIVPTHTQTASIPARGMSGQMYKGAIFWDTEIFMLPFFIHAFPPLARNLLLYRYHTLDGARRKAHEYGYRGAFYAWESQDTGDESCTLFAVTDVFTNRPMRTYFRDKQVHISADIAFAFWKYYTTTGDASIWTDGGAEVVFECARFFLSYLYYSPDKGRYEVLDVTGPDEYHERVHNNAFTNRLVTHTFEVCLRVAEHLRSAAPDYLGELVEALDFSADLARIGEIAPHIYQPDAGELGAVIPQFDGYFDLEDIPLPRLLEKKLHPTEYLGGGNGLATTTQIIKQADVVLTTFLFNERYPLETIAANWEYYEPRTEHGSSLSACSYSLIAAQIGKVDYAYQYFKKTATIDLTGEGKQYVGTLYIGGTHPAANGGAWMSAVFGLCGIRYASKIITINPRLPAHWKKVTVPLSVCGHKLRITLTHSQITVKALTPLKAPLSVSVDGSVYPLYSTGELQIAIDGKSNLLEG
jgi:nigerose phosphorylase